MKRHKHVQIQLFLNGNKQKNLEQNPKKLHSQQKSTPNKIKKNEIESSRIENQSAKIQWHRSDGERIAKLNLQGLQEKKIYKKSIANSPEGGVRSPEGAQYPARFHSNIDECQQGWKRSKSNCPWQQLAKRTWVPR